MFGACLVSLGGVGCGGETGGSPNGIAGALTNATIRVSSFTLSSASSGSQNLSSVDLTTMATTGTPFAPSNDVQSIAGSLYPTRNSKSFRVVLKGAGSNLEDVAYYFDVFGATGANYAAPASTGPMTPNTVVYEETVGGVTTELTHLYVALRSDAENPDPTYDATDADDRPSYWPVKAIESKGVPTKEEGKFQFAFADDPSQKPIDSTPIFEVIDAYTYIQPKNLKAVRNGRRNVIVQFFDDPKTSGGTPAAEIESSYKGIADANSATQAAQLETTLLSTSLTNSYVFSASVDAKVKQIPLTGQFAANNGDNGIVDSGSLDVTATNLPSRWGSVTFEAYEESFGFGKPSIVFSKTVNLTDVVGDATFAELIASKDPLAGGGGLPRTVTTKLPFANRQRILKVYATCYELPGGTGAVLAQTVERGKYNGTADNTGFDYAPYEPVVFIPTVQAQAKATYSTPPSSVGDAKDLLTRLQLLPAISNVAATVPTIAKGAISQTIKVTGDSYRYARTAFTPTESNTNPVKETRTLSNLGFFFKNDTKNAVPGYDQVLDGTGSVLSVPTAPTSDAPGVLSWPLTSTVNFSQLDYAQPASTVAYTPYYPDRTYLPTQAEAGTPVTMTPSTVQTIFAAPLAYTQGSASGTVRGGKR